MIHPVYFTCANHFNELIVSLKALKYIIKNKIYVYCDLNDFFSEEQLKQLNGCIIRKTIAPMSWGGVNTVENKLLGFNQIRKEVDADDYIMNLDADSVLISDQILKVAEASKADLIGQEMNLRFSDGKGVYNPSYKFQHGACYFLRAKFIYKILKYYGENKKELIEKMCNLTFTQPHYMPDDVVFHEASVLLGGKIEYLNYFADRNISIIHFELTKDSHWVNLAKLMGVEKIGTHKVFDEQRFMN